LDITASTGRERVVTSKVSVAMVNRSTLLVSDFPILAVSSSHEEIVIIIEKTIPIISIFLIIEVIKS
jgi:hypothetical protein